MSSNEKIEESIRYIPFSGKDKKAWREWKIKTLAVATQKKWKKALEMKLELPDPEMDLEQLSKTEDVGSNKMELLRNAAMNEAAWIYLTLSCKDTAFNIVAQAKNNNAKGAWDKLKEKFEPNEIEDYIDLMNEFQGSKMSSESDNPTLFIEIMERLNERMEAIKGEYRVNDIQLIAHIFAKLPKSYSEVITTRKQLGLEGVKIDQIKKTLEEFWERNIAPNRARRMGRGEVKVMSVGTSFRPNSFKKTGPFGQFKGICRRCGKQGHKAVDCRVNLGKGAEEKQGKDGKRESGTKTVTCYNCQEKGHYAKDCPTSKTGVSSLFVGAMNINISANSSDNDLDDEESETKHEAHGWMDENSVSVKSPTGVEISECLCVHGETAHNNMNFLPTVKRSAHECNGTQNEMAAHAKKRMSVFSNCNSDEVCDNTSRDLMVRNTITK
jgi:gag-polypeptide of LTR copia-type/Zinc knuckle